MKLKYLPLFLLVTCISIACGNKSESEDEKTQEKTTFTEYADSCIIEGYWETPEDGMLYASVRVSLEIPEKICGKKTKLLRDSISYCALGMIGNYPDLINDYLKSPSITKGFSYSRKIDEIPSGELEIWQRLDVDISGSVMLLNDNLIVYNIRKYFYEGGAHGYSTVDYINYYIKEDMILSASDIFTKGSDWSICNLISNVARENQVETYDGTGTIEHYSEFYIDKDNNVVFVYQQYEIAAYCYGIISIPVKAQDLEPHLTPLGKKVLNVGKNKRNRDRDTSDREGNWVR